MTTLLDTLLPRAAADAVERHRTRVQAPPNVVERALRQADVGGPIAHALLALRALPAALAGGAGRRRRLAALAEPRPLTLDRLTRSGFAVLGERPGTELVLGLTGRFWTPRGGVVPTDPARWAEGAPPGAAQAAWGFRITPDGDGATWLETETRVRCADAASRRAFRRYWTFVRPFSGLLRILLLRSVRRAAERDRARGR